MKSARLPVATWRPTTPDEDARVRAAFEEHDARHRLYITEEEFTGLMQTGLVCDCGFGAGKIWLNPNPADLASFNALIQIRTDAALAVSEPLPPNVNTSREVA